MCIRDSFGGLLTTCGMDHVGKPARRSATRFGYPNRATETLPLHGRVSNIPARLLRYGVEEIDGVPTAFAEGEVQQVAVFGENLVLMRRIALPIHSRTLTVTDAVANRGYASSPFALLYHVNVGWPTLAPGAELSVSRHPTGDLSWSRVGLSLIHI